MGTQLVILEKRRKGSRQLEGLGVAGRRGGRGDPGMMMMMMMMTEVADEVGCTYNVDVKKSRRTLQVRLGRARS